MFLSFFNNQYEKISKELFEKYTLKKWINQVLINSLKLDESTLNKTRYNKVHLYFLKS